MAKLTLLKPVPSGNKDLAHRASVSEGEAARRLLESQGYSVKKARQELTCLCPFHEGPGEVQPRKTPNFYINAETSKYYCQSASCGERGNLRTLERFFGLDIASDDDSYVAAFQGREEQLRQFESALTSELRQVFYRQGLTDTTIERFRLGYDPLKNRYVIPYLEGRRPRFFRYYQPDGDPRWKYTWEEGAESTLFNAQDGQGDKDGIVFLCEGECKAMLLAQMGYAAVAVPGAGQWKPEWHEAFTNARSIMVCFDNDNPEFHIYDRPEKNQRCNKCSSKGLDSCVGHNPGQEAAQRRVHQLGWRAKNVLLPLPSEAARKTDINEYFMRDGHTNADFAELATGKRATPFKVQSLAEITDSPPDEAVFLIEQGLLSRGGRLLVSGRPKVGKSLFINNMVLSLAAGIPFLKSGNFDGFKVDHPCRTLLLDRELSKHSLFKRLTELVETRPGYRAAAENLLIDHDHLIRLDSPSAYDTLVQLVDHNGAEVIVMDTAYKFFGGDIESSKSIMKGFEVLDRLIHDTGVSVVLTHHHRKGQQARGKENTDIADPDNVAGSFLWTGWPNASILLNFLQRSVENPFNSVATFAAFRDAAPPDPVALYRNRDSISYTSVEPYSHEEFSSSGAREVTRPTTEAVEALLLDACPISEDHFVHAAAAHFGVSIPTVRPYVIDALSRGNFERSGRPPVIKFKYEEEPETWEAEHGFAPKKTDEPLDGATVIPMFGEVQ